MKCNASGIGTSHYAFSFLDRALGLYNIILVLSELETLSLIWSWEEVLSLLLLFSYSLHHVIEIQHFDWSIRVLNNQVQDRDLL